jgi:hypothetical protein
LWFRDIYTDIFSFSCIDDLIHFTLKEWTRMSLAPTIAEVERAKSQLKASLLLGLDGTTAIAEDVSGDCRVFPPTIHLISLPVFVHSCYNYCVCGD